MYLKEEQDELLIRNLVRIKPDQHCFTMVAKSIVGRMGVSGVSGIHGLSAERTVMPILLTQQTLDTPETS